MENNMRKVKFLVASLLFCAISYVGYMGYERMMVSEQMWRRSRIEKCNPHKSVILKWMYLQKALYLHSETI